MGFKKEVIVALTELKVQMGENTRVLAEHHKRSTMLEERVAPLENSAIFTNKLFKAITATLGILASCAAVYHYLFIK